MRIRHVAAALLVFALLFALNGCSLRIQSPDLLMAPPKLTGDYQALQDAFEQAVGKEADFVMPMNGAHKSAFIIDDLNHDGKDDAIVLHKPKEGNETVKISVFQKADERWDFLKTVSGAGDAVDCVIFEDLNGDRCKEVIVGWSLFTSKKQFTVYLADASSPEQHFKESGSSPYDLMATVDLNADGRQELFSVNIDTSALMPESTATLYTLGEDGQLSELDKLPIDSNISGYSGLYTDTVGKTAYVLVDAMKNEHDMITEILLWKDGEMFAPMNDPQTQLNTLTWRGSRRAVQDFDADGHLEIPVGIPIDGSTVEHGSALQQETMQYTCWSSFTGSRLKAEQYTLYNDEEEYAFAVPSSWVGKITVRNLNAQLYFYRWNAGAAEHLGSQLFSLVSHSKDAPSINDYSSLTEYKDKYYEYNITPEGKRFGVTDKTVQDGFSLLVENQGG